MILPYYNPAKKYTIEELKKIQARLQKDIEGILRLKEQLSADESFTEADDAFDCFLVAAKSAQAQINQQVK